MRIASLLCACVLASPSSSADVLVVDASAGPGWDFTELQAAVDAAADGDVLLVRNGVYAGVTIDDLSISVLADTGEANVRVQGGFTIRNLSANKRVLVSRIQLIPTSLGSFASLSGWFVSDCAGAVLLRRCTVQVTDSSGATLLIGNPMVRATNSSVLQLDRIAPEAPGGALFTYRGLTATDSTVFVYDSVLNAGEGDVLSAVVVSGGSLYCSGSGIQGGKGTDGTLTPLGCTPVGDGGHGVEFTSAGEFIRLDTQITPGAGGSGGDECFDGIDGEAIAGPASVQTLAPSMRYLSTRVPARDGLNMKATAFGEPGDVVLALYSSSLLPVPFLAELFGPVFPNVITAQLATLGTVDAFGTLVHVFPVHFPHAGQAGEAFVQGIFLEPASASAIVSNVGGAVYLGPGL